MRLNWRASAMAAGAAFVVSVLAGIAGGVPLGTLILRATIGAAIFGAGAAATSLVIDRYLPDLKQSAVGGEEAAEQPVGSRVDIVVDDDSAGAGDDANFMLEDDAGQEGSPGDSPVSMTEEPFVPGIAGVADAGAGDEADEEPAELEEADEESDWDAGEDATDPDDDSPDAPGPAGRLPDMEGLSGDFAESATEYEEVDEVEQSGEDPGIMARAIRTVLKRDQ